MRAGLPVSERDRTVSLDEAARNFCFTTGSVSASAVVSQTEPHHTPCAPSAIAAATWRPRHDAAGSEHGSGATAFDDLGHQHHRRHLAGMAAGLGALRHDHVDAGIDLARACDFAPPARLQRMSRPCARSDQLRRAVGRARSRAAGSGGRGRRRAGSLASGDTLMTRAGGVSARQRRTPWRARMSSTKATRSAGSRSARAGFGRPLPVGTKFTGSSRSTPYGLASGLLVDPGKVDLKPLRAMGHGAQDPHPTGVRHRGDHVPAVAEGEDRELDAEAVTERRTHAALWRVSL